MDGNELHDEQIDLLLTGASVPGHEEVAELMTQLRTHYRGGPQPDVSAALSEFVNVTPTVHFDTGPVQAKTVAPPLPRSPLMTPKKKITAVLAAAAAGLIAFASLATASANFDDGDYTLVLPGVGEFEFTIDSDPDGGNVTVIAAIALPPGYEIDDDDPDKVAWKDTASLDLEVEAHTGKIEGDYDWAEDAVLFLPGGKITVEKPDIDGNFKVTADGWYAFGSGSDWIVANMPMIGDETETKYFSDDTKFFSVEATADGIEIKAIDKPNDGFLNELEDDEEIELEIEEEEVEADGEGDGRGQNNGRGSGSNESDG